MLSYCFMFLCFVVLLTDEWKVLADTAPWGNVDMSYFSTSWIWFYVQEALAFFTGCFLLIKTFSYPATSYTALSHFMITFLVALLFSLLWHFFRKTLTRKKVQIFAILAFASGLAFVADQDKLAKVEFDVSVSPIMPFTSELYLLPANSENTTNVSALQEKSWKYLYFSNEKPILCSKDYRNIAIIDEDMVFGYLDIVPEVRSTPFNTIPSDLVFLNFVNLGLTADEENVPYFKYAILTKDSLTSDYSVKLYALCHAITHKVGFYQELPNWAL